MKMQLSKTVNGEETVIEADNYTATLRIAPDQNEIDNIIRYIDYSPGGTIEPRLAYPSTLTLHSFFSHGFPRALEYCSIVLVNTDLHKSDLPYNAWDKKGIIGLAECPITYSGSDEIRGTYNSAESKITRNLRTGKCTYHLVVDFPTHCANGSFNKVLFYPAYAYTSMTTSPSYFPTLINHQFLDIRLKELNGITGISSSYSTGLSRGTGIDYAVGDDGSIMLKLITDTWLYYYEPVEGKSRHKVTAINLEDYSSLGLNNKGKVPISYFNGSYWILNQNTDFSTGPGTSGVTTSEWMQIRVENGELKFGEKQSFSITPASGSYRRSFKIIEMGGLLFHFYGSHGSSSSSTTSKYSYLTILSKDYVPVHSYSSYISYTSDSGYYSTFSWFYDKEGEKFYFFDYYSVTGRMLIIDKKTYENTTSSFTVPHRLAQSPNGEYLKGIKLPINYLRESSSTYNNPASSGGYYVIGEAEFKKPIVEIDLEEPLNKTNVETLKLIFDFEVSANY